MMTLRIDLPLLNPSSYGCERADCRRLIACGVGEGSHFWWAIRTEVRGRTECPRPPVRRLGTSDWRSGLVRTGDRFETAPEGSWSDQCFALLGIKRLLHLRSIKSRVFHRSIDGCDGMRKGWMGRDLASDQTVPCLALMVDGDKGAFSPDPLTRFVDRERHRPNTGTGLARWHPLRFGEDQCHVWTEAPVGDENEHAGNNSGPMLRGIGRSTFRIAQPAHLFTGYDPVLGQDIGHHDADHIVLNDQGRVPGPTERRCTEADLYHAETPPIRRGRENVTVLERAPKRRECFPLRRRGRRAA